MYKFLYASVGIAVAMGLLAGCDEAPQGADRKKIIRGEAMTPIAKSALWGLKAANKAKAPLPDDATADNYYVIFDGSGSMKEWKCTNGASKMAVAKDALARWLRTVPATANVGLFAFDESGKSERAVMRKNMPAHRQRLLEQIQRVRAGGGTPLGAAMDTALTALAAKAVQAHGYGQYHIVVVTDGIASDKGVLEHVARQVYSTPIIVHTIGFCMGTAHVLNQPDLMIYVNANSPEQLAQGLENVLAESENFVASDFDR